MERETRCTLEESESRLERVLAEAKVGVWEYYPERDEMRGSGRSSLYGVNTNGPVKRTALWDRIIPPEIRPLMESKWDAVLAGREPVYEMEHEVLHPDGERRWILSKGYPQRNPEGQVISMKGLVVDLTSLRRTELDLVRQKKRLSLAHSMLMAFMEELDRERLLHSLLEKALEFSGSAHGCISLIEPDGASLRLTYGTGLFASMVGVIYPVDSGLSGEVLRRGERVRVKNYSSYSLRRDDPRFDGLAEVIGLPLYRAGKFYGTVTIASYDHLSVLDDEILSSLDQFGAAASIALENARLFEDLRTSFKDLVRTMGEIVGKKDPYTVAHQSRVADLACAIAGKLGLEGDMKEGIRIASLVHDIGKAEVPGEILSKPGSLSSIEFDLIKTHAASGYEILRSIAFPWPVAEITYQHHERVNGSGYPRGLSGEEILPEARILAVADVVEAMVSHRPYRPGLGLDEALGEIRSGRGTLYDSSVVDACVEVFEENPAFIPSE